MFRQFTAKHKHMVWAYTSFRKLFNPEPIYSSIKNTILINKIINTDQTNSLVDRLLAVCLIADSSRPYRKLQFHILENGLLRFVSCVVSHHI